MLTRLRSGRRGARHWLATLCLAIAGCAPLGPTDLAPTRPVAQPEPVTSVEGITEYRLANGLKVLLFPDPRSTNITVNVTYRVGSRHEGPGEAGMAHLLEHMLFRGTPTYGEIKDVLTERGASYNGTTSYDRTNYFETLPASDENLELALAVEADRMVNSVIASEELETEMTVVRNEFESGENSPLGVLYQRMFSAAYLFHPYGRPPIGTKSDIENVPVESLRRFYRRYYQPDNATLVIAGKIELEPALAAVERTFGRIPRPERTLPVSYSAEPIQDGERSVVLRRVGSVAAAAAVYHIPSDAHPDAVPLSLLAHVLGSEPSGRLYRELVEAGRATAVSVGAQAYKERGLFTAFAVLRSDQDPDSVLDTLKSQLESISDKITADEVERARTKRLKDFKLSLTSSQRTAIILSEAESLGDWRLLFLHRDLFRETTLEDVRRVAAKYLVPSNRTTGKFVPTDAPLRAEIPPEPDIAAALDGYAGDPIVSVGEAFDATAENIEATAVRTKAGPIEVVMLPKSTRGEVVTARLRLRYGSAESLRDRGRAARLLPQLMRRGTLTRDYQAVNDALDALETELSLSGSAGQIDVSILSTRPNLSAALELVAEILRTPSLREDELDVIRKSELTRLEAAQTDPQTQVFQTLYRGILPAPPESALYVPTITEAIDLTAQITRDELAQMHQQLLGAGDALASVVGDFDPDEVREVLTQTLGDWSAAKPFAAIVRAHAPATGSDATIDTPDKKNAVIAIGAAFPMSIDDPDLAALSMASYVFGESTSSRLFRALRERTGLSYGAGGGVSIPERGDAGVLVAYAIVAPENARRAQAILREETQRWLEEPITPEELAEARSAYAESFKGTLANDGYVAGRLLADLELGRPFTANQQLVDAIVAVEPDQISAALARHLGNAARIELAGGDASKMTAEVPAAAR